MHPILWLATAIGTEIVATTALKLSDGFTRLGWAAVVVVGVLGLTYLGASASPPGVVRVPPTEGMSGPELGGLQVYNEQGCSACHQILGIGGQAGPDLSRAGRRIEEADMRRQIVTPQNDEMPAYDGLSQQQLDDLVEFLKSLR